jgi:hypothetical protein
MSKKPNPIANFGSMMGALQAENAAAVVPVIPSPPSPAPLVKPENVSTVPSTASTLARRPGRPISATSKKQDGRYIQTSIRIMEETRDAVKVALIQAGGKQDTSDLVQSLLENWLKSQK